MPPVALVTRVSQAIAGETPGASDTLIAAVLAKLPVQGTTWSAEQRDAWLRMLAMALHVTFGGSAAMDDGLDIPAFLRRPQVAARAPAPPRPSSNRKTGSQSKRKAKGRVKPQAAKPKTPKAPKPLQAGPRFYIDKQGFARKATGDRVMPGEVNEHIVDQRGEFGDLGAIVWADDSRGVRGLHLDITVADV